MTVNARALPNEFCINVDATKWRAGLPPEVWIEGFPTGCVWRADVFDVADRWRRGEVPSRALAAVVLAWGHGSNGYGPYRTRTVLAADPNGEKLDRALAALRAERPSERDLQDAYVAFRSSAHVQGLGASFFTKLLYFAGYRRGAGGVQPLILDKVVAERLPSEAGITSRPFGWRSSEWISYLSWAAAQSSEPDHVEVALFAP